MCFVRERFSAERIAVEFIELLGAPRVRSSAENLPRCVGDSLCSNLVSNYLNLLLSEESTILARP